MSLIAILPSSSSSASSLAPTTSSAFAMGDILVGSTIAIFVLILVLAFYDVASRGKWNGNTTAGNGNTTAALRAICVPLIVTFCAWLTFETTSNWPSSSGVSSLAPTTSSAFAPSGILVGSAIAIFVLIVVLAFYGWRRGASRTEIQRPGKT